MKSFLDILEKIIFFPWNLTKSLLKSIIQAPKRITQSISNKPGLRLIFQIILWIIIIFLLIITIAVYKSIIISGEIAVAAENSVIHSAEKLITYGQAGIVQVESFATRVTDNIVDILTTASQSTQETIQTTLNLAENSFSEFYSIATGIFNKAIEIFQSDNTVIQKLSDYCQLIINSYKDFFIWLINLNISIFKWFYGIGEVGLKLISQTVKDIVQTVLHIVG